MKSFCFKELDWLICFSEEGNEAKKYLYYSVEFADLKKDKKTKKMTLCDIVDSPKLEYPQTVGYFRHSIENLEEFNPNYLEFRVIHCLEDFWKFLNDLNI